MLNSISPVVAITLFICQVTFGDQLVVLNVPSGVRLSSAKQASLADVQALPYQLFGLDETQSGLLSDVSFFRRPSLLAIVTVACGGGGGSNNKDPTAAEAGCMAALQTPPPADAAAEAPAPPIRLLDGGAEPLLFQPASLADAVARAHLDKALLASTSDLADSTNPGLFAGLDSPDDLPAVANEAGLPIGLVRQMRLVQAAVDRVLASGLLADSQPDALQIDITAAAGAGAAAQRRAAEFAAGTAARLAAAAGPGRAFVAAVVLPGGDSQQQPPPSLVRVGRSLMASEGAGAAAAAPSMNLAADYDQDFPIMFNLILWLSVVLALVVYGVAYGLWNIDPGKDSIIYRRGYAHAKKD